MKSIIGSRIKELRIKKGQTQEELGELLHVKRQTVSKYETGINIPDADILNKLSDILECSSDYLLGKTDIPNSKVYEHSIANIEVKNSYPYDLSPEEVEKLVNLLKKYKFDIDSLIQEIKLGNEDKELK